MTDLTIQNIKKSEIELLPAQSGARIAGGVQPSAVEVSTDSVTVSVPRLRTGAGDIGDPVATIDTLSRAIRTNKESSGAHQGLDAARVFGLLSDDELAE